MAETGTVNFVSGVELRQYFPVQVVFLVYSAYVLNSQLHVNEFQNVDDE